MESFPYPLYPMRANELNIGEMSGQLFDGSQDKGTVAFFALAREIGHLLIDLERDQPPLMMH